MKFCSVNHNIAVQLHFWAQIRPLKILKSPQFAATFCLVLLLGSRACFCQIDSSSSSADAYALSHASTTFQFVSWASDSLSSPGPSDSPHAISCTPSLADPAWPCSCWRSAAECRLQKSRCGRMARGTLWLGGWDWTWMLAFCTDLVCTWLFLSCWRGICFVAQYLCSYLLLAIRPWHCRPERDALCSGCRMFCLFLWAVDGASGNTRCPSWYRVILKDPVLRYFTMEIAYFYFLCKII